MQLEQSERHTIEARGARNSLTIRRVHAQDFGNYSCVADNQLGKTRKTVTLSGKPRPAIFRSTHVSQWKDRYNISWSVDSFAPIEEYRLYYRLLADDNIKHHVGDPNFFDKAQGGGFGKQGLGFNVSPLINPLSCLMPATEPVKHQFVI